MSHSDLARNLDSYGDGFDPSDSLDPLLEAAEALLDELHRVMPVWPEHAQALAEQIGWDPPTEDTAIEQALVRRAERAEAKALTTAERTVLHAARDLSCAQAEVESAIGAWMAAGEHGAGAEWDRMVTARRARNHAADHLYNVASRDLAESQSTDVPEFLRAYLPATTPVANGAAR